MSRQEDFIDAGIAYRMKHGKPMCIAGSKLADVERDFNRVMSFEEGAEHGYQYCPLNYGIYRKPNVGMLGNARQEMISKWGIFVDNCDMLMIGDASGLLGQYSDTDRKTAENFGIDYMDVYDFTREFLPKEYD